MGIELISMKVEYANIIQREYILSIKHTISWHKRFFILKAFSMVTTQFNACCQLCCCYERRRHSISNTQLHQRKALHKYVLLIYFITFLLF